MLRQSGARVMLAALVALTLIGAPLPGAPVPPVAAGPSIGGAPVFPADNIWNRPVTDLPVHPQSAAYLANIGLTAALKADFGAGLWNGGPIGIPYAVVAGSQPTVPIHITAYGDESDPGPFPIPPDAPIEGGPNSDGDRHVLVVDKDNAVLYELYRAFPNPDGSWNADSAARWPLTSNALRPDTWTSADAAGLPILPGLARYDEVAAGAITHALRFTVPRTRKAHLWPARHDASSSTDPNRPPMGLRLRLKAAVDISGYPAQARVVLQALKDYGMILADNGSALYVSGAPDERWDNDQLARLRGIRAADFEAVDQASLMVDPNSAQARGVGGAGGPAGAATWYFAEGYTGPGFDQYLTIQNPNGAVADVAITYFRNGAGPVQRSVAVAPRARVTVAVHEAGQGVGHHQEVSALVQSVNGVGIVVERPIYFTYGGALGGVTGGHTALGVQAPRPAWLFAEGYTGPGFDAYLTILNPHATAAPVTITYYLSGGQPPVARSLTVPASRRATVAIHDPTQGVGRDQAVAARVETSLAGGIVVERPVYFRYSGSMGPVTGGHTVMGAAGPRLTWSFGDGNTATGWDEYLTVLNPSATDAHVRLTYYIVGQTAPLTREVTVAANSRATVPVFGPAPGIGRGHAHGTTVTSTNGVGIVVERPIYFAYNSAVNGGHDLMGVPAPAPVWLFAEGYTGPGFDEYLVVLNPNATTVGVTITYYAGGNTITRSLTIAPFSRATVAVHDASQVGRNQAVAARVETTHPGGIVVERSMYFIYGAGIDGGHTALGYAA